jgi:hypothetical protein
LRSALATRSSHGESRSLLLWNTRGRSIADGPRRDRDQEGQSGWRKDASPLPTTLPHPFARDEASPPFRGEIPDEKWVIAVKFFREIGVWPDHLGPPWSKRMPRPAGPAGVLRLRQNRSEIGIIGYRVVDLPPLPPPASWGGRPASCRSATLSPCHHTDRHAYGARGPLRIGAQKLDGVSAMPPRAGMMLLCGM